MAKLSRKTRILILHAPGTNRDEDLSHAFITAGGNPEILPLSLLVKNKKNLEKFGLLALPGGFSYGDALGAGRLWALELQTKFQDFINDFVESGRPVIGICNGFQALVKAGILPKKPETATLTYNQSNRFECRWVNLQPNSTNPSPWLTGINQIFCPVAHGEGRFLLPENTIFPENQIAFRYCLPEGEIANGLYPYNPNGSILDIAGITNPSGNVIGLMPHPENHIFPYQHPKWTRRMTGMMGLSIFENGIKMMV